MKVIFGTKLRCAVLSIAFEKSTRRPGISVNTVRRLIRIALMRTTPRSPPSLNCIKMSATIPEIVVSELPIISGMDFERATTAASLTSMVWCSSL